MPPPMPVARRHLSDEEGDNEPESTVPEGELPMSDHEDEEEEEEAEDHIQMQNVASPMQVAGAASGNEKSLCLFNLLPVVV